MRIFTKSILALLCLAMATAVQAQEDEIIDFNASFYHSWSEVSATATDNGEAGGGVKIGEEVDLGGTIWGNLTGSVPYLCYANITDYSELRFEGTPGGVIRIMCNRTVDEGAIYEVKPTIGEDGKLTVKISDLKFLNGGTACDFVCLQSIKVPATWQGGTTAVTITSIKIVKPGDALAIPKETLKNAINDARKVNALGKTAESYQNLQTAIANAEAALKAADATESSLTGAASDLRTAIAGVELAAGYSNLTAAMFKHHVTIGDEETATETGCAFVLGQSTGQPYGDGSVVYLNYADLTGYSKLILLVADGTPRIMMNRAEPVEGGDANGGDYVQITDAPVDGVVEVDLTQYEYAHLNAIKGANWANVTVTEMLLYKEEAQSGEPVTPFYGVIWGENEDKDFPNTENWDTLDLDGAYFKDFVKKGDILRFYIKSIGAAEGRSDAPMRGMTKTCNINLFDGEGSLLYESETMKDVEEYDIVISETMVEKMNASEKITVSARNMVLDKIELIKNSSTGISQLSVSDRQQAEVCNLAGQRVMKLQKGINIVGGKKIIVK